MKRIIMNIRLMIFGGLVGAGLLTTGCQPFLEVDPPNSRMGREVVFQNEGTGLAALNGLYHTLFNGYASGSVGSLTINAGLSADELRFSSSTGAIDPYVEINENAISPDNAAVSNLWANMYAVIYAANAIIEGAVDGVAIPSSLIERLRGEALFVRAFTYFYLLNLFGEVPMVMGTDYRENAGLPLKDADIIYERITADLEEAVGLLDDTYPDVERSRPNRLAIRVLQARIALFQENWTAAEGFSGEVIGRTDLYRMAPVDEVFLKNSGEAIWQRVPFMDNTTTGEAALFLSSDRPVYTATVWLYDALWADDRRRTQWMLVEEGEIGRVIRPYKYRAVQSPGGGTVEIPEYSIILRLAEQYLIRAEARTRMGDLSGAVDDLDVVRKRAGLPLLKETQPYIGAEMLLDLIMAERRKELFAEWGHRWLDLKRTGQATDVLTPLKPGFTDADLFYPIPESERLRNPNLN